MSEVFPKRMPNCSKTGNAFSLFRVLYFCTYFSLKMRSEGRGRLRRKLKKLRLLRLKFLKKKPECLHLTVAVGDTPLLPTE